MLHTLRDRPIFICGHPKAGTSLLRAILDSHPQLVVYPEESIFFRRFLPKASKLTKKEQLQLAEKELIHIFQWNQEKPVTSQAGYPDRDYSFLSYEDVRQNLITLIEEKHNHPGDILSAAVLAYGYVSHQINPQTARWVEKSPYNEYYANQIFEWWPEARCIHILRDPRDNFVSYRRKHPDWGPEFFSTNWFRSTQAGFNNQKKYSNERYMLVRYEDLTASPELRIREILTFLEIPWDEALMQPTRAGVSWQGNSMFSNQFQSISQAPVARWKEKLNRNDASVISLMTMPFIENLGYSQAEDIQSLTKKNSLAYWRKLTWPIRKHFKRFNR